LYLLIYLSFKQNSVRAMDAVSARLKWREKYQKVAALESVVSKYLTELDIAKGYEKHERKKCEDLKHTNKLCRTTAQVWEKKDVWLERVDPTSGEIYYENVGEDKSGATTIWEKPEHLSYYYNGMTKERSVLHIFI